MVNNWTRGTAVAVTHGYFRVSDKGRHLNEKKFDHVSFLYDKFKQNFRSNGKAIWG